MSSKWTCVFSRYFFLVSVCFLRDTNGKTELFWGVPYFDTHPDAELADCRPLFSSLRHSLWIRPRLDIKHAWAVLAKQLITAPFLPLPDASVCLPVFAGSFPCLFLLFPRSFLFVYSFFTGEPPVSRVQTGSLFPVSPPPPPKKPSGEDTSERLRRRGWIPASSEISLTWPGAEARRVSFSFFSRRLVGRVLVGSVLRANVHTPNGHTPPLVYPV